MKVLVTGGNSYCGRYVIKALFNTGHEVRVNVRKPPGLWMALEHNPAHTGSIRWFSGDLNDRTTYNIIAGMQFDAIVHMAAQTHPASAVDFVEGNVEATKNVLDYAERAGVKKFINFSSISVVDKPKDVYSMTKAIAEDLVNESSTPSLNLRLPAIVGPGSTRNYLSETYNLIRNDKHGLCTQPYNRTNKAIAVEDLAKFVVTLVGDPTTRKADTIQLGANTNMSWLEIIDQMYADQGKDKNRLSVSEPYTDNPTMSALNIQIAENRYGFKSRSMEETIRSMTVE